jgi:hypothetical protein
LTWRKLWTVKITFFASFAEIFWYFWFSLSLIVEEDGSTDNNRSYKCQKALIRGKLNYQNTLIKLVPASKINSLWSTAIIALIFPPVLSLQSDAIHQLEGINSWNSVQIVFDWKITFDWVSFEINISEFCGIICNFWAYLICRLKRKKMLKKITENYKLRKTLKQRKKFKKILCMTEN